MKHKEMRNGASVRTPILVSNREWWGLEQIKRTASQRGSHDSPLAN